MAVARRLLLPVVKKSIADFEGSVHLGTGSRLHMKKHWFSSAEAQKLRTRFPISADPLHGAHFNQ